MTMRIATAAWADPDEVEERYPYRDGTVWLGRSGSEGRMPLGYLDDRHVCLVGGSRGGKGTTSIIPALITWPGSLCVVDPKGENATITAARRGGGSTHCKGMGQTVKVLDPFQSAQVADSLRGRFNPLDTLDPKAEETIDEAGRIADAIVVVHEGGTNDPFWDESARAMVKGLLLHVLTSPQYEGRRNLVTLRKLITRGDWESIDALREAGEKDLPPAHGLLWTGLSNNPAFDGLIAGAGDSFTNMLINSPKQYESVLQVANRNTEFIDSPAMQRLLEASDFQLSELKTRPEGLSLFLCLPQRYMNTHYRWLRMMISLTVTEMEKVRGRPKTGHPILMVLDEFAGLKRMEVIETAAAQIAGYGVKLFFVLQSLEQLKATYKDNWETFLANSGLKLFFNLEDNFSRDYVSKLIGETEVVREVRSNSDSTSESESTSRSVSRSESHGTSSSTGTSENEGTNSSVSSGTSGGSNWSRTKGKTYTDGRSWTPTSLFLVGGFGKENVQKNDSRSWSDSLSTGGSKGWNKGRSDGVSRGTSRSQTDGTSETSGTSETEGTTRGTSQSRTEGSSETIQKRALVTPDEIGQLFARVDDRARGAYPGLALVVISGAPPVALRRVNYYEDFQFVGLFDPNPDYPFSGPKELCVEGHQLGVSWTDYGLSITAWSVTQGQIAAAGTEAATVAAFNGLKAAVIRVPRAGMIGPVPGDLQARLFSVLFFGDDADSIDALAEVREFCKTVKGRVADKQKALTNKRSSSRGAILVFTILAAVSLLAMIAMRSGAMLVPLVAFGSLALWKKLALSGIDTELLKYGVGPAPVPVKAAAAPVIAPTLVQTVAAPVAVAPEPVAAKPAPEIPEPVAAKPEPAVSVEPALPHKPNWFAAHWKLIAGVAVGLVLLLVVAQAVIRNQNEKAAQKAREDKSNYEFEHRDFDPSKLLKKENIDKGRDAFDRNFYEQRCGWGDAVACGKTAVMYWDGRGATQDRAKALALHRKACDGGYAPSCEALKTLPDSQVKAAGDELFRQAGTMSTFGANGKRVEDSQGDATAMFVLACDAGSLPGCAEAAARYRGGNGVPVYYGRALELYRKACAGGERKACEDMKEIPAAK
jgi:type IV secretory pathway TraG/TraD family ATPase VirD4